MQASFSGKRFNSLMARAMAALVALVLFLTLPASAQSVKSVKEREAAVKSGEQAKQAILESMEQFNKVLSGYNAIMDGSAKDPQKSYKTVLADMKAIEGKRTAARKGMEKMDKQAQSFFTAWEKELEMFSDEGIREKAGTMMEDTRGRYQAFVEKMATASELFEPLVKQLNDQVLFLGRMLTPEGIEALQDEAAALNEAVTAAIEQAREILGEAQNVKPDDGSVPHPDGA